MTLDEAIDKTMAALYGQTVDIPSTSEDAEAAELRQISNDFAGAVLAAIEAL